MGLLKTIIAVFIGHKFISLFMSLMVLITVFFLVSDLKFMEQLLKGVETILNLKSGAIVKWAVGFATILKNMAIGGK